MEGALERLGLGTAPELVAQIRSRLSAHREGSLEAPIWVVRFEASDERFALSYLDAHVLAFFEEAKEGSHRVLRADVQFYEGEVVRHAADPRRAAHFRSLLEDARARLEQALRTPMPWSVSAEPFVVGVQPRGLWTP